ncbi:MAG: hypothetical protein ACKVOW_21225 [Chitinophagaceae bacterium]
MKKGILLFSFLSPFLLYATTWPVGPLRTYKNPSEVASLVGIGDTIEIDAATYVGDVCAWTKDKLVLIGVGGRPHLRANGNYALGKGIWVFVGNNITVENIEFSEATVPDQNGAGIRLDGMGIIVKSCYFHNNENGILTGNNGGVIRINNSEFSYNGFGDGFSHNIYIGRVDSAIIRYSYFHHANAGHELKSRARANYILYNRISNESTGNASREIDLPNGGVSILIGNIVHQGTNSLNGNIVGYGLEGLVNTGPHEIYVINNTMVNERFAGSFLHANDNTQLVKIYNSIFAGAGSLLIYGGSNVLDSAGNIAFNNISNANFVNPNAYDFHLNANSLAINIGVDPGNSTNGINLSPAFEYLHIANFSSRTIQGSIDAGSYERSTALATTLLNLKAAFQLQRILITWQSVNELTTDRYEILRSYDQRNFTKIGGLNATLNNSNYYQYIDKPSPGLAA